VDNRLVSLRPQKGRVHFARDVRSADWRRERIRKAQLSALAWNGSRRSLAEEPGARPYVQSRPLDAHPNALEFQLTVRISLERIVGRVESQHVVSAQIGIDVTKTRTDVVGFGNDEAACRAGQVIFAGLGDVMRLAPILGGIGYEVVPSPA
jgi:hypothetical protein